MASQKARIVRVEDMGIAYINDEATQKLAAFSFDKIRGYKGQTAAELKLKPGREVDIEYDAADGAVKQVNLQP